ncbi:MAG: hypothetical protein ACJ8G7_24095 [Rhizobacter sp.]
MTFAIAPRRDFGSCLSTTDEAPPSALELSDPATDEPAAAVSLLHDIVSNPVVHPLFDWSWAGKAVHQSLTARGSDAPPGQVRKEAASEAQVKTAFKQEFAAKAANKADFDAFMREVYGDRYDKTLAEQYRQQALNGDFSFLPDVKFVDSATLHGGHGAYNAQDGVVYIDRDLAARDPAKAAQTFVEEAGHHLDAKLNTTDAQGDEGELFRRLLSGEQLSQQTIDSIRSDDDHGTITVDGKQVDVEFWFGEDIVDGVADVASSVVDKTKQAVGDAVDYAGNAARDVVYSVGDAIKETGMGVINGVGMFMQGAVVDFFGGTFMNLLQGHFADAFDSMTRGIDKMVFQAPRRIFNGALEGFGHVLKTATYLLPEKAGGAFLRDVIDRGVDSVRSVANAAIDIVRNFVMLPLHIVGGVERDIGEALKYFARGDVDKGFGRLGMTFVHPFERIAGMVVDDVSIAAQAGANVVGNMLGIVIDTQPPSRGLNNEERGFLHDVYGDSLNVEDIRIHRSDLGTDAGMAPHTVGNDIYLPDNCFNADGSLNELGRMTLVHEAFHAYQAQHEGNEYIHCALEAQMDGIVGSGNRNAGYTWLPALHSGKPFNEWNPEQQAKFIEDMARARYQRLDTDGNGTLDGSYDANGNGQIDRTELETVLGDNGPLNTTGRNGRIDGRETAVSMTDDDFERAMAIWSTLRDDRPDRALV